MLVCRSTVHQIDFLLCKYRHNFNYKLLLLLLAPLGSQVAPSTNGKCTNLFYEYIFFVLYFTAVTSRQNNQNKWFRIIAHLYGTRFVSLTRIAASESREQSRPIERDERQMHTREVIKRQNQYQCKTQLHYVVHNLSISFHSPQLQLLSQRQHSVYVLFLHNKIRLMTICSAYSVCWHIFVYDNIYFRSILTYFYVYLLSLFRSFSFLLLRTSVYE